MGLDSYCRRYLAQWEKRATVRTLPRYRAAGADAAHELFPSSLQPLASHPAVVARGPDTLRELLVRTAYSWQSDIASLEIELVTDLCGKLATRGAGCPLPESARQAALTIATDEVYHAYAAREFVEDVRQHTGIEPAAVGGGPALAESLTHARRAAPEELRREVETLVLCFAEHFVTESLFGLSKDTQADNPFHLAIREHLIDEGRHQDFFRNLLRHVWSELDDERRTVLGRVLPGFLDSFLCNREVIRRNNEDLLEQSGFEPGQAREIAEEVDAWMRGEIGKGRAHLLHAQHCLKLIRLTGMLDHAPTRDALTQGGWLAGSAAPAA